MFFSKCAKFHVDSENAIKYLQKAFAYKINAFELVTVNFPFRGENSWHRQSMG